MPELPEVETTARGIAPHIVGVRLNRLLVRERRLRWPIPDELAGLIEGERLEAVRRRGKYILLDFPGTSLIAHLGMSGSLRVLTGLQAKQEPPRKHDHYDLVFANGHTLRYHDPRRFGCLLHAAEPKQHALIKVLGPEPLTAEFDGEYLAAKANNRTSPVKSFIMDSHVVVGVGNIYAAEALFATGIHPLRAAGRISAARYEQLAQAIKTILGAAIERGGTTLKDFVNAEGEPGYFALDLQVYGRGGEPCLRCQHLLKEVRLNNRSTVYCPHCQR